MKHRFRLFHLPVYIFVFIGLALVLYLHLTAPRDSLLEYALALEDGQFICETGGIYEAVTDYPASGRIYVKLVDEVKGNFKVNFKNIPAEKLLPHEFAMQMTNYGSIYIDNDGNVWHDTHEEYNSNYTPADGADNALLIQYLTPAAELDTENAAELYIFDSGPRQDYMQDRSGIRSLLFNYYSLRLTYSTASANSFKNDLNAEFSVLLKDGWYAIPTQRDKVTIYIPNIGFDTDTTAQCRLTVFEENADHAFAFDEFEMLIRSHMIHISNKTPKTYHLE